MLKLTLELRTQLIMADREMECFIGKLKYFRRVFSCFDKYARRYLAVVRFASTVIWLK